MGAGGLLLSLTYCTILLSFWLSVLVILTQYIAQSWSVSDSVCQSFWLSVHSQTGYSWHHLMRSFWLWLIRRWYWCLWLILNNLESYSDLGINARSSILLLQSWPHWTFTNISYLPEKPLNYLFMFQDHNSENKDQKDNSNKDSWIQSQSVFNSGLWVELFGCVQWIMYSNLIDWGKSVLWTTKC